MRLTHAGRIEWAATITLVAVTFCWGSSFLVLKNTIEHAPVFGLLALRFALAAAILAVLRPRVMAQLTRRELAQGCLVGLALTGAYIASTYGLRTTAASVSGFIVGMYVVLTPLLASIVLRRRIEPTTWAGVGLAVTGLALISLKGFGIGGGEALTLLSSAFLAVHLLLLERFSTRANAYRLAVVQLAVVAIVCGAASPFDGGLWWPQTGGQWGALAYLTLAASAFAFLGQTWAQSILPAARCAVIMTMEPVFAGLSGVIVGHEPVTWRLVLGGMLVLLAMLVVELGPRRASPGAAPSGSFPPPPGAT